MLEKMPPENSTERRWPKPAIWDLHGIYTVYMYIYIINYSKIWDLMGLI